MILTKEDFANKNEAELLLKSWQESAKHLDKSLSLLKRDQELIKHIYLLKNMNYRWCCNLKKIIEEFDKE